MTLLTVTKLEEKGLETMAIANLSRTRHRADLNSRLVKRKKQGCSRFEESESD